MKYVIFESNSGLQYPIIFPNFIQHCDIVRKIQDTPLTAGFCYIDMEGRYGVYGKSVSLNLNSHPNDENILNKEE